MIQWLKNHYQVIIATVVTVLIGLWLYACEPKVPSVMNNNILVTRAELQIELDQLLAIAEQRMIELDRQDAIRNVILQNALLIASGQPLNPIGLITAFAAIYGVGVAGSKAVTAIKNGVDKRKANNVNT